MLIKDSKTLRNLTSSWYESNDFDRVSTDVELETEELAKIVGDDIIEKAQAIADKEDPLDDEIKLLRHVQLPIALMVVFRYFQTNIVSHDQSSRKMKVDNENEKIPFEWMLNRDDAAHLAKAHRAVDRLIAYLDKTNPAEWANSPNKEATRNLFVNNTDVFAEYYPTGNSPRFYYTILPLLREIQHTKIKDALGDDYDALLSSFKEDDLSPFYKELLELTRRAQVLASIALAVRRLNTTVLPDGLIKAYKADRHTTNASRPAEVDEVSYFSKRLEVDAFTFIDKIKLKRHENDPEYQHYQLLPKNDPCNKFAST